ncbi:hypothetical protein M1D34_31175 (plasmid) [Ensifer sp. D2-11]
MDGGQETIASFGGSGKDIMESFDGRDVHRRRRWRRPDFAFLRQRSGNDQAAARE